MGYDREAQTALNDKHAADPQPGDYWHEMFAPIVVVVRRKWMRVTICRTKKAVGPDRWTWDLDKLETMSLGAFKAFLMYGTIPGYYGDVEPMAHGWVSKEAGTRRAWPHINEVR